MTKHEIELTNAFNELEVSVRNLQTAQNVAKGYNQGICYNYYCNYIIEIDKKLVLLKKKFYEVLSDVEE